MIAAETRNERIALSAVNSGACQDPTELAALLDLATDARIIVEIGTHKGYTFSALTWAAARGAICISIDIKPPSAYDAPELVSHCAPGRTIVQIIGDSNDDTTSDRLADLLDRRQVDLLFIDGDHRYDAVNRDHLLYHGFVKRGSPIAFHDIEGDCVDYWGTIYPHLDDPGECIASSDMGLGWYRKP